MTMEMNTLEDVEQRIILRTLVGSSVHGTNVHDGLEDRDEMAVCVEPLSRVIGPTHNFEQFIYRTAAIREGKHDAKSRAGDLDLTVYSLRKWVKLALDGNPTVLLLLFAKPMDPLRMEGMLLQSKADLFASKRAGHRFLGYLQSQKQRLTGERGQKRVNRPELIEKYGYDTKYAMQMLRLGFQGIEYLQTGKLQLPMHESTALYLRNVRNGKYPQDLVVYECGELEDALKHWLVHSPLPDEPETDKVMEFVQTIYEVHWVHDMLERNPDVATVLKDMAQNVKSSLDQWRQR